VYERSTYITKVGGGKDLNVNKVERCSADALSAYPEKCRKNGRRIVEDNDSLASKRYLGESEVIG
jgi:hypothetical protein